MEDYSNIEGVGDSLNVASKEWNRIIEAAKKDGYRKGVEDGSNSVFQEGFDQGYKEGFQTAFILGKFKSLLNALPADVELPRNIKDILDKTGRGACHLCATESQDANNEQKSFWEIVKEQRTHSMNVLQTLYDYFQPYAKQINVSESDILKIQHSDVKLDDSL